MRYSSLPPTPDLGEDPSGWDDGDAEARRSITGLRLAQSGGKLNGHGAISYDYEDIKLVESGKPCLVPPLSLVWHNCD